MPELLTQQVGLIRSDVDVDLHTQTAYLRGIIAESCLVHMCQHAKEWSAFWRNSST